MKERLTGAAILVALIVLLVPELLRGPVRPVTHALAAPSGEPPLRSYIVKLGDDAHVHGAAAAPASGPQQPAPIAATESSPPAAETSSVPAAEPDAVAPPSKAEAAAPKPAATSAARAETPAAKPAAPQSGAEHAAPASTASSAASVPESAAASGAFLVQLGSFASSDNANRLAKQVKAQGFTVSVVRGSSGRHLYKVLVGPARDHAAALQLEAKLRAAGHAGSVVAR